MTAAPCATCRQEVDHLLALDSAIRGLTAKTRTHHGLRATLAHHIATAGHVARRHRRHREDAHGDERRATIRDLAQHLHTHAEEAAA